MINLYDANNTFRRGLEQTMPVVISHARQVYSDVTSSKDINIFVWDGHNHNARRRALFDGYKRRDPTPEDVYSYLNLMRELLIYSNATQVEVPEWEADDVIATLARYYVKNNRVTVHSNDLDYFQLESEGVTVKGVTNPLDIPARHLCLFKCMVGDPSDKIPGIPGFGKKTFFAMQDVWDELIEYIESGLTFEEFPFKPAVKSWLTLPENRTTLQNYWKIVQLWPVDIGLIETNMHFGIDNPDAAEALLRKYML